MFHLFKTFLESGILVSDMSTFWEETDGRAKQDMCALAIYSMTVISYSHGIISDCAINAQGIGKNVVDGLNAKDKHYLKGKMELVGKLVSNYTTKIDTEYLKILSHSSLWRYVV